ncbi:T9SS type A sorting domain-containing protein, partial [Salinimicrobium gaetbulicola]
LIVTVSREFDETPVALTPIDDYMLEDCNAEWPATLTTSWTDNCGVGGMTSGNLDSDGGGEVTTDGCIQRRDYTFSVTDDCGNYSELIVTVSREFDETPVALTPIDDYMLEDCNAEWPANLTTSWTDNCGVGGQTSGNLDSDGGGEVTTDGCIQSRDYTFSVTDDCGNYSEMVVTVSREFDETPVALTPIDDYMLEDCNAEWPANLTTSWTDNCGVGGQTSGNLDSDGGGEVSTDGCIQSRDYTFSVTDDCGNYSEMVVTVSREFDETPVALTPIDDYMLEDCNAEWPANLTTSWTDNCGVGGQTSGNLDSDGGGEVSTDGCIQSRDYTFSVTDDCGNYSEMVVTVSREFDETPVALTPIDDYMLEDCNAEWPANLTTSWTDNCGVGGQTSGNLDSDGGGEVSTDGCIQSRDYTFSVTDDCGNYSEMVVTVSREFDETPVALTPIDDYMLEDCNAEWPENLTTSWTDNCGVGGMTSGNLNSDGGGEVSTDGCIQSRDYTFSVTDDCGNYSELIVTVSREFDETPPVIIPPMIETVCESEVPESLTASWTDNCSDGGDDLIAYPVMVGSDECSESYEYTFSVTDDCGNSAEETITVVREFELLGECETIFGYDEDSATCFSEYGFSRWGWTHLIAENSGSTTFDLYAGAAQCMIGKGSFAGTATITYEDGYVTVEYNMASNYVLNEAHVYIGCEPVPSLKNGKETVAPGQYPFNPDLGGGVHNYTVGPVAAEGDVYVIVHGVACEVLCQCTDGGTIFNGNDGGQSFDGAEFECDDSETVSNGNNGNGNNGKNNTKVASAKVKTFPVPFKETVNLQYDFDYTSDVTIEVFNMRGNHLRTYTDRNVTKGSVTKLQVDFAMKANQMYILKVTTDRETFVEQIVSSKK